MKKKNLKKRKMFKNLMLVFQVLKDIAIIIKTFL